MMTVIVIIIVMIMVIIISIINVITKKMEMKTSAKMITNTYIHHTVIVITVIIIMTLGMIMSVNIVVTIVIGVIVESTVLDHIDMMICLLTNIPSMMSNRNKDYVIKDREGIVKEMINVSITQTKIPQLLIIIDLMLTLQ